VWVPEVIREPKMHYWTVPKLGSFMAVPLVYKSCLNINSFDKSVKDYTAYKAKVKEQNEEKAAWEITVETAKAEAENAGTKYEEEAKEWEVIEEPEVEFTLKKFVICIDSIGQDR